MLPYVFACVQVSSPCSSIMIIFRIVVDIEEANTAEKAMECERFGNCLTNARQKIRYVFGQNFTDLVYEDRRHSLLTAFVPGSRVDDILSDGTYVRMLVYTVQNN